MKQAPQDIIILRNCTKNYDYRLNCSWDTVHGEYNFYFSFLAIFCPFTRITAQKLKISKKWKKHHREVSSFYRSVPKIMIICLLYCFWDMARDVCICCFSFWEVFCTFVPITAQKMKISKKRKKKNTWRYHDFTQFYRKVWL